MTKIPKHWNVVTQQHAPINVWLAISGSG